MTISNVSFVYLVLTVVILAVAGCGGQEPAPEALVTGEPEIDQRSYRLGSIGTFAEMVGVGVKKMGLSAAMPPDDMDALIEEAQKIVVRNNAQGYREADFLVTDLFPEEVTKGRHVLVIYNGATLDEYQALKAEKQKLKDEGKYEGEGRKEIARAMGRLLSYPESKIEKMLAE